MNLLDPLAFMVYSLINLQPLSGRMDRCTMRQGLVTPSTGSLENRVDNAIDSAYHSNGDVNPDHPETVGGFDIYPNTGNDAKRIIVVLDRRMERNGGDVAGRHEFKTKGAAREYILKEMRAIPQETLAAASAD